MSSLRACVISAVIVVSVCARAGLARDTLNPKTYTSPDGSWSAYVEPATKDGDAGAKYVVKHNGESVWQNELSFALWDGQITDSGLIAGYAYEYGLDGRPFHRPNSGHSYLYAVIIDEAGHVRLQDGHARHEPAVHSTPPGPCEPAAAGVIVDPAADVFIIRIPGTFGDSTYTWWRYRLSTGEKLADVVPHQPAHAKDLAFHREISVQRVSDAPLVLTHWFVWEYVGQHLAQSAQIQLTDYDGKDVWNLDLRDEYSRLGRDWDPRSNLVEPGIVQVELSGRNFTIRSYSLGEKIKCAIVGDAKRGWSVNELSREADQLPVGGRDEDDVPAVPQTPLKLLGTIHLGSPATPPPSIEDICGFSIDDQNNMGFIRPQKNGPGTFTLVSRQGKIVRTWLLPDAKPPVGDQTVWLEPGKWLVYSTGLGDDDAAASVLDVETGGVTKLPVKLGGIKTACRAADGGFAMIGGAEWVGASSLFVFDREGTQRWSAALFSPQSVTMTSDGTLVALENISNQLVYFSPNGQRLRETPLRKMIGYEPEYPTGVEADAEGGVIVLDFAGKPSIRRFSMEEKELDGFTPTYDDGRAFRVVGNVQRSPDGNLWTSDGHALLQLTDKGEVDQIFGAKPAEGGLRKARYLTVGSDGRVYVVNERDGRIYVFDCDGNPITILKPDPKDFSVESPSDSISIAGDGEAYCQSRQYAGNRSRNGYVHFDSNGDRLGYESCSFDTITEEWLFQPGTHKKWMLGYETIALADEDGAIVKTIKKRPNGNWLERVGSGAVAPDGSLAVIASPEGWGMRGPATVNIYASDGKPICTLPREGRWIPYQIAFNGRMAVTCWGSELQFHYLDGRPAKYATLPTAEGQQDYWYVFFSPDGKELLARNADTLEISRFALP